MITLHKSKKLRILTYSKMGVDGSIPSGACKVLTVSIGNMLSSLRVSESLSQTEIYDIYVMLLLPDSNKEIVRLDISMQEVSRVNKLDSL